MTPGRLTALSLLAFASAVPPCRAWWEDGHVVVCRIAEQHLKPATRAAVKDLLDGKSLSDPEVCVWADRIIGASPELDRKYPNHRTWHYINLELKLRREDYKPDQSPDQIVGAIERLSKVLADPAADRLDRREALMFLAHFVGDLHQPLHCCNRGDDKGGNLQPVKSVRGTAEEKLNLHKVWDGHLVKADRGPLTLGDYVARLAGEIADSDRAEWLKGEAREWAWESHVIGVKTVYHFADGAPLPARDAEAAELTEENYVGRNRPVIRDQLKKGGVRLAKVLNGALAGKD